MADADIPTKVAWVRTALDQYEAPLVRYAARITGDVDRARDVVQETFLRLCTEPRAKVDGHLREWLFAVCRNQAVDVLRKEGRMRSLSDAAVETHASRAESPPAVAEGREAASDVGSRALGASGQPAGGNPPAVPERFELSRDKRGNGADGE